MRVAVLPTLPSRPESTAVLLRHSPEEQRPFAQNRDRVRSQSEITKSLSRSTGRRRLSTNSCLPYLFSEPLSQPVHEHSWRVSLRRWSPGCLERKTVFPDPPSASL